MKLSSQEIAAMIAEVRCTQEACNKLNDRLQALCPHEEYVEGLSIVACVMPILLCKICGHTKSIERFDYEVPPQD